MPKQNEPIPYEVGETYVFTVHTLHDASATWSTTQVCTSI